MKGYYQKFTRVNTFPNEVKVKINNKKCIPCRLSNRSGTPSFKGKHETVRLTMKDILQDDVFVEKLNQAQGKFLVTEPLYMLNIHLKKEGS